QPDRQAHVAMVVVDLPLRVGPGSLWVNSDECVTELVDAQVAERGDFNVKPDGLVELADAEAVYACSPGFRDAAGVFRPTGQLLSLTASDQQLVAVSAFNFEQGGWETLAESYKNGNELALGARHASPIDGSVFLRVAVGRRNPNQPPDKPAQIRTVQVAFAGRAL
ncbi:MAG: hypothetical protein NTW86_26175, partial [Candidatus Sumerlaeota bacterium]|nr:hypothetical protein [Candidatus Sumerlaeota bacterium]